MTRLPMAETVATIAIAGVPVRVESEIALVRRYASQRFPPADDAPIAVHVRVRALSRRETQAAPPRGIRWTLRDADHLCAEDVTVRAELDLERGMGEIEIDERALAHDAALRRALFEGMLYVLINRRDRHPVHAAALRLGDAALVLHGSSGVGKSTVAWEAHRAGIAVLADDASRIQLSPELRVWGDGTPARIHLLEPTGRRYDELRDLAAEPMGADNEPKLVVSLPPDPAGLPYARAPRVVLLTRSGTDVVRIRPASAGEISAALLNAPEAEMDLAPANRARVIQALAARGGWHMDLSPRASDAVPHLRAMLQSDG